MDAMDEDEQTSLFETSHNQMRELTLLTRTFERTVLGAFRRGASEVKSFESALRSTALTLSSSILRSAIRPLTNELTKAAGSLFGNLMNSGQSPAETSNVMGFSQGGVFASPRYFPSNQGLGVMAEAGAEAIMPLSRGPDGRLGVAATGNAAPKIVMNISTPDAPSFLRSETQISAALARAVARGRRGL
jgi:phage-related minor tail protein